VAQSGTGRRSGRDVRVVFYVDTAAGLQLKSMADAMGVPVSPFLRVLVGHVLGGTAPAFTNAINTLMANGRQRQ
jgi:hypothetical protein